MNKDEDEEDEEEPPFTELTAWKPADTKDITPWDSDSCIFLFLKKKTFFINKYVLVKTGEEEEESKFSVRCKLYSWVKEGTVENWKERGVGTLKVNVSKANALHARLGKLFIFLKKTNLN